MSRPLLRAMYEQLRQRERSGSELLAHGLVLGPALTVLLVAQLPVLQPLVYALVIGLLPLSWVGFRYGWRAAALALVFMTMVTRSREGLLTIWTPQQLQLLVVASGIAALLLGASTDALGAQGKALMLNLEQLRRRSSDPSNVANRVTSVQEQERRRIGGEPHEVPGQDITAIATRLRVVERSSDDQRLRAGLNSISLLVNQSPPSPARNHREPVPRGPGPLRPAAHVDRGTLGTTGPGQRHGLPLRGER
ncbi:MAG: hypothetical protein ABI538_13695 [Pseudoxanthomonas sp.]